MKGKFLLSAACFVFCAGAVTVSSGVVYAQEAGAYSMSPSYEEILFEEYNVYREPCQHYREPPAGYVWRGCKIYRPEPLSAIQPRAGEPAEAPVQQLLPVAYSETIYFDFDRSYIREGEREKLAGAIAEIKKDNPDHVTVSGYTDRAGSADYNMRLSQRRADAVAEELMAQGIKKEVIGEMSYGETDPAVPTADGVKMQENRRAVIDFVR